MGESEYAMNHYGQAESWFQESINQGNTDKEVYFRKGICNLENKIYSRAVNDFSMALLKDSSNARGLIFRAQSYIGVGEYELARDDLSRAREIEPDNPDIYFNRAQLFENFRDYDRAILDYSRVIRLRPDDHFAYYSRGRDRVIMGEYVPALNDLDKALSLNDSIPEYLRTRGDIKYQINRLVSDPCSDWLAAAQMGDKNARFSMDKYCK